MEITHKQLKEITEDLETGTKVYTNKETLESKSIPDWDILPDHIGEQTSYGIKQKLNKNAKTKDERRTH